MTKTRLTKDQRRAMDAYKYAEQQEDRLGGSVFANAINMRAQAEKTRAAYLACKALGMGTEHGL